MFTTQELDCYNKFITTGTIVYGVDAFNPTLFREHGHKVYADVEFTIMRLMEIWHHTHEGKLNGLMEVEGPKPKIARFMKRLLKGLDFGYQVGRGDTKMFFILESEQAEFMKRYQERLDKNLMQNIECIYPNTVLFSVVDKDDYEAYYQVTTVRSPSDVFHLRRTVYVNRCQHIYYSGKLYKSLVLGDGASYTTNMHKYYKHVMDDVITTNGNVLEWNEPIYPLFYFDDNDGDNSDPIEVINIDNTTLEVHASDQLRWTVRPESFCILTPEEVREYKKTKHYLEYLIYYLAYYPNHRRAIIKL